MTPQPTAEEWAAVVTLRPLFAHIAHRHRALAVGAVDVDDMVQVGTLAALDGLRAHNPERGTLQAHMARRAEAAMVRHARRHGGPVRVPYHWQPSPRATVDEWADTHPRRNPWPVKDAALTLSALLRPDSPDDAVLLGWAYGWRDKEQAPRMGVSGERVRQRREAALARLRRRMGARA